jgi:hypothetical protein
MELQDIISGLEQYDKLREAVKKGKAGGKDYAAIKKQLDPALHEVVTNKVKYPDKQIKTDTGIKPGYVARIPVPLQKMIVDYAAMFLCGNPVELEYTPEGEQQEDMIDVIKRTWKDNKLDYESKKLAKLMMSETEVAELWYVEEAKEGYWKGTANDKPTVKYRLRMKILANRFGDGLYPVFNAFGDMVAFGREYTILNGTKKEEHFDIYTEENNYLGTKKEQRWEYKPEVNIVKKIPVVYYSQEQPEWSDVQWMIDRYEMSISKHANSNDYFGYPLMAVTGKIESFADKGDDGKVVQLTKGADIKMVTWPQAPESVKLEQHNLIDNIFLMSYTPKLSEEQVKGLGTYSGVALRMLFLPAHMKASDKEETFGKGLQRRINYLKAALGIINTDLEPAVIMLVEPKFKYFLPKNEEGDVDILVTMKQGGIMSQKTAVGLNPMVTDAEAELALIKEEGANQLMNEEI